METVRVLVLGIAGMLGSMVFDYLHNNKQNWSIFGTVRKRDNIYSNYKNIINFNVNHGISRQLRIILLNDFDYIINCIGVINKYCRDYDQVGVYNAIKVNSIFPHELLQAVNSISPKTKIIQIATDCVFSGKKGPYDEYAIHDAPDVYGKSKSLGEVRAANFLNIRCSIIGYELEKKNGLLEWFLSQHSKSIQGYQDHLWNGVTTLQFAEFCCNLMENNVFDSLRNYSHSINLVLNKAVSKYELLTIFKRTFNKEIEILKVNSPEGPIDRRLTSRFINNNNLLDMAESISMYNKYCKTSSGVFKGR